MGTCLRNKLTAFCPDWKSLDFYIVLLGLAFCRAWDCIVPFRSCSDDARDELELGVPACRLHRCRWALPLQRDALQRRIDSRRECAV